MTDMRCEEIRELAPEVALDIATGEERDAVLRHVSACGECRRLVFDLSSVSDGLLLTLAPARDPGPEFESNVLETIAAAQQPKSQRTRRRPWLRLAYATGAVAIAVVVGGGAVYQATSPDRQLGEAYRATLEVGRGSSFAAAPVYGPEGRVGTVFGYQGDPSWVMVTLDSPAETGQTYQVRIATRGDGYSDVGEAHFEAGDRTWGETLPVDLTEVIEMQFVDEDGRVVLAAPLRHDDPWSSGTTAG